MLIYSLLQVVKCCTVGQQLHWDFPKQSLNQLNSPGMHCQHVAVLLCQVERDPSLIAQLNTP